MLQLKTVKPTKVKYVLAEPDLGIESYLDAIEDRKIRSVIAATEQALKTCASLEQINEILKTSLESQQLPAPAVITLNTVTDDAYRHLGLQRATTIAVEDFNGTQFNKTSVKLALEENENLIEKVWNAIIAFFQKLLEWINTKLITLRTQSAAIYQRARGMKKQIAVKAAKAEKDNNTDKSVHVEEVTQVACKLLNYLDIEPNSNKAVILSEIQRVNNNAPKLDTNALLEILTDFSDFQSMIYDGNKFARFSIEQILSGVKTKAGNRVADRYFDANPSDKDKGLDLYESSYSRITEKTQLYILRPKVNSAGVGMSSVRAVKALKVVNGARLINTQSYTAEALSDAEKTVVLSQVEKMLEGIENFERVSAAVNSSFNAYIRDIRSTHVRVKKNNKIAERARLVIGMLQHLAAIQTQVILYTGANVNTVAQAMVQYCGATK